MSGLDDLAPDQRAVLQMVLQRGRSYDEIAGMLSIDRAAVRQRALAAFDALTPPDVLPGPERALVTDYLLRQLPERVAEQVHSFLGASDVDRTWALALAEQIAPLTSAALPEIPAGAPLGADDWSDGGLEPDSDPPAPEPEPAAPVESIGAQPWIEEVPVAATAPPSRTPARESRPREPRRSSRRGGAILLSTIGVAIVAVIVIVIATSGGGNKTAVGGAHTGTRASSTHTATGTTTTAASTTTTAATMLAQLNLKSPSGAKSPIGITMVERVDGVIGMVIYATGVPANTKHNAYAVWLYNSSTSDKFVGFVPNLVGKSGRLSTEGKLPADATKYDRLLITLETQSKPSSPGEVVLSGPFRE
jgi:hypothetical protein